MVETFAPTAEGNQIEDSKRNQAEAKRVLEEHYPFKCCVVCGLQMEPCLTIAHLDQVNRTTRRTILRGYARRIITCSTAPSIQ